MVSCVHGISGKRMTYNGKLSPNKNLYQSKKELKFSYMHVTVKEGTYKEKRFNQKHSQRLRKFKKEKIK